MSTYVRRKSDNEVIVHLSKEEWELPSQIKALEVWLNENQSTLEPSSYIADIGFSMRKNACGGGAILSINAMSIMAKLGITLFLSEYPDD